MKQEKRISYKAGITRRPSDFLCEDGELAECINLTTDGEELKVVPMLEVSDINEGSDRRLVYVHRLPNGVENKIYEGSGWLYFNDAPNPIESSEHSADIKSTQIAAIGKTLSVIINNQLTHFLWTGTRYKNLGEIADLEIKAELVKPNKGTVEVERNGNGIIKYSSFEHEADKQEAYNDMVVGSYQETIKLIAQKGGFAKPFFVRAALEMYDGTYTKITNPLLMWPTIDGSTYYSREKREQSSSPDIVKCETFYYELRITQSKDFSEFADIIKDVVLFVSDGIDVYDTLVDQKKYVSLTGQTPAGYAIREDNGLMRKVEETNTWYQFGTSSTHYSAQLLETRKRKEIYDEITRTSIFYKLCTLGLRGTGAVNVTGKIGTHILENLTNQPRLDHDDYYSRCPMKCSMMYPYNRRLNIAGVERGFFPGFRTFMPLDGQSAQTYTAYVRIKTDSGIRIVKKVFTTREAMGNFFYYPDSRADRVTIYSNNTITLNAELKEHPGLNGAYFLTESTTFNNYYNDSGTALTGSDYTEYGDSPETLDGQLVQSQVNNPFTFLSEGYHQVGTGRILAMTSVTMALSQDQFGRTDLLVLSDDGIWGMQVDNTGLYESSHPLSREVCVNPGNIVQTDNAVFFVSKKGLMVVDENGRVGCVSEQLDGKAFDTSDFDALDPGTLVSEAESQMWAGIVSYGRDADSFQTFIQSPQLRIAYDYMDSRLLLLKDDKMYCWVYSLRDGSFSKMTLSCNISNVVNNYPDYLLQDDDNCIYSLYDKKREEESEVAREAFLLTRPMKVSGPVTVTSLRELVNVGMWDKSKGSMVKTEVFVSNDLQEWYKSSSRFGAAAKYYRIALFIKMKPYERLSGTIIRTQDRRTENVRE
jgi:hypothetical protein